MQRLLILRHAHSEPAGPQGDRARALSTRGHDQCASVLAHMREADLVPDAVVCSPAARTLETWKRVSAIAPGAKLHSPENLYMGDENDYTDAVATVGDGTVLLVGHNPTCAMLACGLKGAADLHPMLAEGRYPTGSLCVADATDRTWRAVQIFVPERPTG